MFIASGLKTAIRRIREHLPILPRNDNKNRWSAWRGLHGVLPDGVSRRGVGFALAIAIELLIILLLLSLGFGQEETQPPAASISTFDVSDPPNPAKRESAEPEEQPEAAEAQPEQTFEPRPSPLEPAMPALIPLPDRVPVRPARPDPPPPARPEPQPTPSPRTSIGAVVRSDRDIGPADTGSARGPDSERVGTAPDGSPLYAARWYREPSPDQLSGYLSAASGPGWGLIACKTAPNWRVEECAVLDEYPKNSGIARAVQAAAWQFQVRPPRLGGDYQVGTWVRIRIDYTRAQRSQSGF
ncbi:MAG: hypothetical protein WA957_17690 [Alteraurantiacibacter sp.]